MTSRPLLEELEKPVYEELRKVLRPRRFARKAMLFEPLARENLVFIVRSGRVRVFLAYEEKEFCLAVLGAGDMYSTHTRAHVQAIEDVEILAAPAEVFHSKMEAFPALSTAMIRVLGALLSRSITIIDSLAFKKVGIRLLEMLAVEAAAATPAPGGGVLLDIKLTTEQLAGVLGTTRQTLSSLLNSLSREGVLELRGKGSLFIADPARLHHIPASWESPKRGGRSGHCLSG